MADEKLRIIIEAISQKAADQIDSVSKAIVGITAVAGTAAAVYAGLKQVMELGAEGAKLQQLEQSYDQLNTRVGLTTDTMAAMRSVTNGTVSDQTMMKGALTLTAGASAEYEKALMAALPQIAEMSKAASKLNPMLGSTEYFFDKLTLAAKRQSAQLADDSGAVISMNNAIKKVHPALLQLTDNYEDLTKEQKFLNEMLFQGDQMMRQVGGSTESATDVFDQMNVSTQKLSDSFKQNLIPAATGIAKVINELAEKQSAQLDITRKLRQAYDLGFISIEDYGTAIRALRGNVDGVKIATNALAEAEQKRQELIDYDTGRFDAMKNQAGWVNDYAASMELANDQVFSFAEKAQFAADRTAYMAAQAGQAALANASLALSLKDATEAAAGQAVIGMLNDAYRDGQIEASTYAEAISDIGMATGLMDEKSAALAGNLILITDGLVKNQSEAGNMGEAVNLAFQSAQSGVENFGSYLESQLPGLVHASQKASVPHLEKMKEDLDNPRMSAEGIGEALRRIPGTYEATVVIHTIGGVPSLGAGGGGKVDSEEKYGNAAGGSWMVGPSWHNDSFPLGGGRYAQAGEQVDVTPAGQTAAQNALMSAWMEKLDNTLESLPRRIAREMLTTVV